MMAALLRALGSDSPVLDELMSAPVFGAGRPVGEIRPAAALMERVRSAGSASHA
jgi:hypothetical protein